MFYTSSFYWTYWKFVDHVYVCVCVHLWCMHTNVQTHGHTCGDWSKMPVSPIALHHIAWRQSLSMKQKLAISSSWDPPISASNSSVIDMHRHVWVCEWVLRIQNQGHLPTEHWAISTAPWVESLGKPHSRCYRVNFHLVETDWPPRHLNGDI